MNENLAYREEPCRDPWREELIAGKWVAMSPASMNHNRLVRNITGIFDRYLMGRECEVFTDGAAVYLSQEDVFLPDVMVVCDPDKVRPGGIYGAPDLVVEILSPRTMRRDRQYKMSVYEKSGVKEYWIVSQTEKTVEQYVSDNGKFVLREIYTVYPEWLREEMKPQELSAIRTEFKCSLYDDLIIRLEDIFRRVP